MKNIKLSENQKDILIFLSSGKAIVEDKYGIGMIEQRIVQPNTLQSLKEKELIKKQDLLSSIKGRRKSYVISEKGVEILKIFQQKKSCQKNYKSSPPKFNNPKICGKCMIKKGINEFVDLSGNINPRGKYCKDCYEIIEKENREALLKKELDKIPKLKIIFGRYWKHYAFPSEFSELLYNEREFCPYCGRNLSDQYSKNVKDSDPFRNKAHIDHMDPLSRGEEDSICNSVYVCWECNYRKGNMLFTDWVNLLSQKNKEISLQIYIDKHGFSPNDFIPGESSERSSGVLYELMLEDDELLEMYPKPIVNGPPRIDHK